MANPLEQFVIKTLVPIEIGGINISITNSTLFAFISIICAIFFWLFLTKNSLVIPNRLQMFSEMLYDMLHEMLDTNVGEKGKRFFPIIFSLFMFILFANIVGLIPYAFTITSHVAVTFTFGLFVILTVIVSGFYMHGFKFLRLFAPEGIPLFLQFVIVPIEIVSFFARAVSLSVRLAANMIAGHIMIKVFASFIPILIFTQSGINYYTAPVAVLPFLANIVLNGFEIFIACLQAYIFSMLTCIYLNDAVNLH